MAVDAVLWLIPAAMAGWIGCGCIFTRPAWKPLAVADAGFDS